MSWNKNGNYSPDDLMVMQKDAMERVRQMQRRADEKLRRTNPPSQQMRQSAPPQKPPSPQENHPQPKRQPNSLSHQNPDPANFPASPIPHSLPVIQPGKITAALSALGVDHDRVILLAVLLILYNDGADVTLLLAILYLLL